MAPMPPVQHHSAPRHAVVAGAGLIGLATAFELRRRGVAVTLADPRPASGATHAAAGMLAPIAETQYGQESLYPLMAASAVEYPAFIERVSAASGLPTGYRTEETLVLGVDSADAHALQDLAAHQRAAGMQVENITACQARKLEPALAPHVAGAIRVPTDHQVDPRLLAASLIQALDAPAIDTLNGATDPGPARWFHAKVERVLSTRGTEPQVTGVLLEGGETVESDVVVLATGLNTSDTGQLPAGLTLRLRPVYGDILRLSVPDSLLLPGEEHLITRTVRGQVHGRAVYLVPRADRTLVLGATSREDGRASVLAGGVHQLLRDARAILPAVDDCDVLEMLARARPGTPDDLPYMGLCSVTGLVISTGHFRHGILLTPVAARLAAELATGVADPAVSHEHDSDFLTSTDPARHSPAHPEM